MNSLHNETIQGHYEFNLCTGYGTSINQLAEMIAKIVNLTYNKITKPERKGDIKISIGCPDKLHQFLNLKMKTPLFEGLKKVINS